MCQPAVLLEIPTGSSSSDTDSADRSASTTRTPVSWGSEIPHAPRGVGQVSGDVLPTARCHKVYDAVCGLYRMASTLRTNRGHRRLLHRCQSALRAVAGFVRLPGQHRRLANGSFRDRYGRGTLGSSASGGGGSL